MRSVAVAVGGDLAEGSIVYFESVVLDAVESISVITMMPISSVVNRLVIDGLRYEYGLNAYTKNRILGEKKERVG